MTGLGDTVGTADIAELLQGLADVNGSGLVVAGQPLQGAEPAAEEGLRVPVLVRTDDVERLSVMPLIGCVVAGEDLKFARLNTSSIRNHGSPDQSKAAVPAGRTRRRLDNRRSASARPRGRRGRRPDHGAAQPRCTGQATRGCNQSLAGSHG
jgi:hypothetical protein